MSSSLNPRPGVPRGQHPHVSRAISPSRVSRVHSPSRVNRPCSNSPCRKVSSQDSAEEAVRPPASRWRGIGSVSRGGGQASTKIPRFPAAGARSNKENIGRGRGAVATKARARIVKPVVTVSKSRFTRTDMDAAQNVLIDISTENSLSNTAPGPMAIPKPKSPILTSKNVPDLHARILEKIKQNKRRSIQRNFQQNQSPCKAPAPSSLDSEPEVKNPEDLHSSQEYDRDSPMSGQDIETYLASVFNMVDEYRSGAVKAGSLFDFIKNLVDLPKLDKWKLEELQRLLDPNNDNRYVDRSQWASIGESWVEMMMNPDYHSTSGSGSGHEEVLNNVSSEISETPGHKTTGDVINDNVFGSVEEHEEALNNISFGSIEGFGVAGCDFATSARELELEGKVNELNFQLNKVRDEKRELERNLVASEEFGLSLHSELEDSNRRLSLSTSVLGKPDKTQDDGKLLREFEQKCLNLQSKVDSLEEDVSDKEEKIADLEVKFVSCKAEVCEAKDKEEAALLLVEKLREKITKLEEVVQVKDEEINKEVTARELIEEKFEETKFKMSRLEQDLSMKDEELRNLTETTGANSRLGSVGGSSHGDRSYSAVHDVSVDEKGLEEHLKGANFYLTPGKLPSHGHNPLLSRARGPSASSTPNKGTIYEEFMNANNDGRGLPSPFCEKKEAKIGTELDGLIELVRKTIGFNMDQNKKTHLIKLLTKEILSIKQLLEEIFEDLPSKDEIISLKELNQDLEERLNAANTSIENLRAKIDNNNHEIEEDDDDTAEEEVANVSVKVEAVADLLRKTNSLILAHTASETETDFSLDPDTDTSGWQLDLEGIQLVNWKQKLIQKRLSGHGLRSAFPTELSKSPVPGSGLWQDLYRRLDDLNKASEMSRDLLLLANDSLREQSQLQMSASMAPNKSRIVTELSNVGCQTAVPATSVGVTQTSPEDTPADHTECLRENCFCPESQSREARAGSRWRTLFKGVFSLVLFLVSFTFLFGVEIDDELYYPVTWWSLRAWLGDSVPDPVIALSYQTGCRRH